MIDQTETIGDNSAATRRTPQPNLPPREEGVKEGRAETGGQVGTMKVEMLGLALTMLDQFPAACRAHDDVMKHFEKDGGFDNGITLRKSWSVPNGTYLNFNLLITSA
ncbi:MAG: hypothetical protein L0H73_06060 [Nitrococcus sp.]|nr:hypothetical protein [Nitrococcus sp.]